MSYIIPFSNWAIWQQHIQCFSLMSKKWGCLNIFTGCFFFFVNLNYKFLCCHTIVLICCKTINYLIIQYLYVNFSATIKNVRAQFSRAFIASCCNDSRRVQFTEKKKDDLRSFTRSDNIFREDFLRSLAHPFIDLWICCSFRSSEAIHVSIYKQLCIATNTTTQC